MSRWAYERHRRKPHVHPLATPSGFCLTTVEPADHPWHRGLWFAVKFVDGDNFWEELAPYGVQRHRDDHGTDIDWIGPDRATVVVHEQRTVTEVDLGADDAYALDVAVTLRSGTGRDLVLDRTPFTTWGGYGGLTLRGRPDWTGTRLLVAGAGPSPDGSEGRDRVLGERSPWCDLSSPDAGGVAVLDHPANPDHPVPWYASTRAATYGDDGWSNFLNAAFLWDGARELAAGDELRFAYRVVVHDGLWAADRIEDAYRSWTATGG